VPPPDWEGLGVGTNVGVGVNDAVEVPEGVAVPLGLEEGLPLGEDVGLTLAEGELVGAVSVTWNVLIATPC
jgi:hypothetical protein